MSIGARAARRLLGDWRGLLAKNVEDARPVLKDLLDGEPECASFALPEHAYCRAHREHHRADIDAKRARLDKVVAETEQQIVMQKEIDFLKAKLQKRLHSASLREMLARAYQRQTEMFAHQRELEGIVNVDKRVIEISDNLRRGVSMPHLQRAIDNAKKATRMNDRCACGKHAVSYLEAK